MYRVIRVILESSLESEIPRTLRTPSLSDNETLKTLRTQSLMTLRLLRLCGLGVFGSMGLWHTSDLESIEVWDSEVIQTSSLSNLETLSESFGLRNFSYFQTPSLLGSETLPYFKFRVFPIPRLDGTLDFESLGGTDSSYFPDFESFGVANSS